MDDYRLAGVLALFFIPAAATQVNAKLAYDLHMLDDGIGNQFSQATGINNSGDVIGVVLDFQNNQTDHILWQNQSPEVIAVGIGDSGQPLAMNDAGMIVGSIITGTYNEPATWSGTSYVWNNGTLTLLPPSGVDGGFGIWALNNHGVMAGVCNGPSAAISDGSTITTLPGVGGLYSWATAINDAGVVAGEVQLQPDRTEIRGFVDENGVVTRLGSLGGSTEIVSGINQSGMIIGFSLDAADQLHAVMWLNGILQKLPTDADDLFGVASGINSEGDIVGTLKSGVTNSHPFATLWSDGQMVDLNTMLDGDAEGFHLEAATGINDLGEIVGYGSNADGSTAAFLLTPTGSGVVPEPGGLAMLGLMGGLMFRRRAVNVSAERKVP